MSKEIIKTEVELARVLNSPLIIPNSRDRDRLSRAYQGRKDKIVVLTVSEKTVKED